MRLWEKQTFQAKTLNSRLSLVSLFFFSLADKLKFHFFMNMILILAIPAISTANPKTNCQISASQNIEMMSELKALGSAYFAISENRSSKYNTLKDEFYSSLDKFRRKYANQFKNVYEIMKAIKKNQIPETARSLEEPIKEKEIQSEEFIFSPELKPSSESENQLWKSKTGKWKMINKTDSSNKIGRIHIVFHDKHYDIPIFFLRGDLDFIEYPNALLIHNKDTNDHLFFTIDNNKLSMIPLHDVLKKGSNGIFHIVSSAEKIEIKQIRPTKQGIITKQWSLEKKDHTVKSLSFKQITPTDYAIILNKEVAVKIPPAIEKKLEQKDLVLINIQRNEVSVKFEQQNLLSLIEKEDFILYKEKENFHTKMISSIGRKLRFFDIDLSPMINDSDLLNGYYYHLNNKNVLIGYNARENIVSLFARDSDSTFSHQKTLIDTDAYTQINGETFLSSKDFEEWFRVSYRNNKLKLIKQKLTGPWRSSPENLLYRFEGSTLKIAAKNSNGVYESKHEFDLEFSSARMQIPHLIDNRFVLVMTEEASFIMDLKAETPYLSRLEIAKMNHINSVKYKGKTYIVLYNGFHERSSPVIIDPNSNPMKKTEIAFKSGDLIDIDETMFRESIYFSDNKLYLGGSHYIDLFYPNSFFEKTNTPQISK